MALDPGPKHLPSIIFELVSVLLPRTELPSARLTSKQFAAAVNPIIRTLNIKAWGFPCAPSKLPGVTVVSANVSPSTDWVIMQQWLSQLPKLQTLYLHGRRTWHKMAGQHHSTMAGPATPSPAAVAANVSSMHLKALTALHISGSVKGLADVAALAPQLKLLYCSSLQLDESAVVVLPTCTHFGGQRVCIVAETAKDAATAFAAAFPNLQVLFETPEFKRSLVLGTGFHTSNVALKAALSCCTQLHSLRLYGDSVSMGGMLAPQLQKLPNITRVAVYGVGPVGELKGMGEVEQLQHLRLSFRVRDKPASYQLMKALVHLPCLQTLAIPVKLLCPICCPLLHFTWLQSHVVTQLRDNASLQQLVLLDRPATNRRQLDQCPHAAARLRYGLQYLIEQVAALRPVIVKGAAIELIAALAERAFLSVDASRTGECSIRGESILGHQQQQVGIARQLDIRLLTLPSTEAVHEYGQPAYVSKACADVWGPFVPDKTL